MVRRYHTYSDIKLENTVVVGGVAYLGGSARASQPTDLGYALDILSVRYSSVALIGTKALLRLVDST